MEDALQPIDNSAVSTVVNLGPGETFSRSRFIPIYLLDAETIVAARKTIRSYLSPVVARAKMQTDRNYTIHTAVAYTQNYDVVVTGVIVAEDDDAV